MGSLGADAQDCVDRAVWFGAPPKHVKTTADISELWRHSLGQTDDQNVVIFQPEAVAALLDKAHGLADLYLESCDELEENAFQRLDSSPVAHWMNAIGLLFDLSLRQALLKAGLISKPESRTLVWLFRGLPPGHLPVGIKAWVGETGAVLARVWSDLDERVSFPIENADADICQNTDRAAPIDRLRLKALGLLSRTTGSELRLPVIDTSWKADLEHIETVAERIVDRGYKKIWTGLAELQSRFIPDYHLDGVVHACARLTMERAAARLAENLQIEPHLKSPSRTAFFVRPGMTDFILNLSLIHI